MNTKKPGNHIQLQQDFLQYVDRSTAHFNLVLLAPFFRDAINTILAIKKVVAAAPVEDCTAEFIHQCTGNVRIVVIAAMLKLGDLAQVAEQN